MASAICVRCGASRARWDEICPDCGHRPEGQGLLVAWLLSSEHLSARALEQAAAKIASGQSVRASPRMLETARRALGHHLDGDPGLSPLRRRLLLAFSFFITALPGLLLWWSWKEERPRSARQALWLSLPAGALAWVSVGWLWWQQAVMTP